MLPKENRVTKEKDIDAFFGVSFKKARGKSASSKLLVVKVLKTGNKTARFGFVVNLKVDKRATVRNKLKRQLREIVHSNLTGMTKGNDVLVVVLPGAKKVERDALEKDFIGLLKKLGLLK